MRLILVNGAPGTGKSTLARRYVADHPLALDLDIDVVRGLLGRWLDQPADAGRAARGLALVMAEAHLRAGHDVVVPQFLRRPDFIDELSALARRGGAELCEVVLMAARADVIRWFTQRSAAPAEGTQRDAVALVDQRGGPDAVGEMYDDLQRMLADRQGWRAVTVVRGDPEATYAAMLQALQGVDP